MAGETVFVELRAIISDFQAKMAVARGEMDKTEAHGSSKFSSLAAAGGGLLAGVGVAAVGVGALAVKMGNDLEDSRAKLEAALKGAGQSFDQFSGPISKAQAAMENLGFTNAQTEDALATGVVATGSASKALNLLQTAANLAAFKHIDLSDAMTVVAKASEGQLRPLKALGIDLPVAAGGAEQVKKASEALATAQLSLKQVEEKVHDGRLKGKAAADALATAHLSLAHAQQNYNDVAKSGGTILDTLNKRLGGQAASAASTFSGKMEVAKARTEDLLAKLGMALIPVIERVIQVTLQVVMWFEKHKEVAIALGIAIGSVLLVAITAYTVSMISAAVATIAATWPILAIIAAVAALGVGIYELVTHWSEVWGFIKGIVSDAVNFITSHWQLMVQILVSVVTFGIGAIPMLIWHYWSQISGFSAQLWHDVSGFFTNIWHDAVGFMSNLASDVGRVFVNLWTFIYNNFISPVLFVFGIVVGGITNFFVGLGEDIKFVFVTVFDFIARAWNDTVGQLDFKIPSWVPGIGGNGFSVPKIPMLAAGTDFFQGGLAIVGEAGPELVNLPRGSRVTPNSQIGSGGPTGDLVIQLNGTEFARVAGPTLRKWFEGSVSRNAVRGRLTS